MGQWCAGTRGDTAPSGTGAQMRLVKSNRMVSPANGCRGVLDNRHRRGSYLWLSILALDVPLLFLFKDPRNIGWSACEGRVENVRDETVRGGFRGRIGVRQ